MKKLLLIPIIALTAFLLFIAIFVSCTHYIWDLGLWFYLALWMLDFLMLYGLLKNTGSKGFLKILPGVGFLLTAVIFCLYFVFALIGLFFGGGRRKEFQSPDKKHTVVVKENSTLLETTAKIYAKRFVIFLEELPCVKSDYPSESSEESYFQEITLGNEQCIVEFTDGTVKYYNLK